MFVLIRFTNNRYLKQYRCEVQFDYGLRGKRSRPIDKRPTSFKSSTGKVIFVEQRIAERNNIRTKQGLVLVYLSLYYLLLIPFEVCSQRAAT